MFVRAGPKTRIPGSRLTLRLRWHWRRSSRRTSPDGNHHVPTPIWHDRAVLHFLTERRAQDAYVGALIAGTEAGSRVVISTFAPDGPERCSNLPVVRYSAEGLAELLGKSFALVESRKEDHLTAGGQKQVFTDAIFERH